MARYGKAYKDRINARLLPPESAAVDAVSREVGVRAETLERWRAQALAGASGERGGGVHEHGEAGEHRTFPAASTVARSAAVGGSSHGPRGHAAMRPE